MVAMDSRAVSPHRSHVAAWPACSVFTRSSSQAESAFTARPSISIPRIPRCPSPSRRGYAGDLAQRIGPFYTQGIEEDTAALRQGVFTLARVSRAEPHGSGRARRSLARRSLALSRRPALLLLLRDRPEFAHALGHGTKPSCSPPTRRWMQAIGKVMSQAGDADHGHVGSWLRGLRHAVQSQYLAAARRVSDGDERRDRLEADKRLRDGTQCTLR